MMRADLFLLLAVALSVLGMVRLLTSTDLVRRVIALNIASGGVLMVLGSLAARSDPPDSVPHALALTGIVITVSVTGLALVIVRRIEAPHRTEEMAGAQEEVPSTAPADDDEDRPGGRTAGGAITADDDGPDRGQAPGDGG